MGPGSVNAPHSPSAEAIVEEAQRRVAAKRPPSARLRGVYWLSRHWLALFNLLDALYLGIPFLAPVLMHTGHERAANVIYRAYRFVCHQLPFRSWFLFGEHAAYPLTEPISLPALEAARDFIGNAQMGYKVAFCQRDVAIYAAVLLGGLIYAVVRRRMRLKPLPWWAFVLFGIVPMGLDGGYQWFTYFRWWYHLSDSLPHETTPLMRTLTGALFGFTAVWLTYPLLDDFFDDLQRLLKPKFQS